MKNGGNMEKVVEASSYLKEETIKTIELIIAEKIDKKSLPDDNSFFVSIRKENGCIAKIKHKGKIFYLHQKF